MSIFTRKETFVFKTEQQRDAYIEKLAKLPVDYEVSEDRDNICSRDVNYLVTIRASDLKKVS